MTTPHNYEPPSEQTAPGIGGYFEPEDNTPGDVEETDAAMSEMEDDERARREQDAERRAEDEAP